MIIQKIRISGDNKYNRSIGILKNDVNDMVLLKGLSVYHSYDVGELRAGKSKRRSLVNIKV